MALCLECWHDLDSCRLLGFAGAGPIPWTAITEWCRWQGVDRELTLVLLDVIRHLDVARSERIASEAETKGRK